MATYGWVTEAEADTYFATRLGASTYWASGAEKAAALTTAYNNLVDCGKFSFPSTATDKMKRGQYEQALFLLQQDSAIDLRLGLRQQGVTKAEEVGETYGGDVEMAISPIAAAILDEYAVAADQAVYLLDIERQEEEDVL